MTLTLQIRGACVDEKLMMWAQTPPWWWHAWLGVTKRCALQHPVRRFLILSWRPHSIPPKMFMLQWDIESNRHKSDKKYWWICSQSILWLRSHIFQLLLQGSQPLMTSQPAWFDSESRWVCVQNQLKCEFRFSFIKKGHHYEKMHQPVENLQRFNIKCFVTLLRFTVYIKISFSLEWNHSKHVTRW